MSEQKLPVPVLTTDGLLCLVRHIEGYARDDAMTRGRLADTSRRLATVEHDNQRMERTKDDEIRAYHKALEACLSMLKKRGVKAKDMPALPSTWQRNAKQIADYDDIPF